MVKESRLDPPHYYVYRVLIGKRNLFIKFVIQLDINSNDHYGRIIYPKKHRTDWKWCVNAFFLLGQIFGVNLRQVKYIGRWKL